VQAQINKKLVAGFVYFGNPSFLTMMWCKNISRGKERIGTKLNCGKIRSLRPFFQLPT